MLNHAFRVHFQHVSLLKALVSRFLLLALLRLRTQVPLMPQIQELRAGPGQVQPTVGISTRDPELKSTVF